MRIPFNAKAITAHLAATTTPEPRMSEPTAWLMTLRTPSDTLVTIATARREDVQNAERSGRLVTCEALCKESTFAALAQRAEAAEAERDALAEKWGGLVDNHGDPLDASGILEYVCIIREELSHMTAERDALRKVAEAATDTLKFGAHDGPCDNEDAEDEACMLHVEASRSRTATLRAALDASLAVQPAAPLEPDVWEHGVNRVEVLTPAQAAVLDAADLLVDAVSEVPRSSKAFSDCLDALVNAVRAHRAREGA